MFNGKKYTCDAETHAGRVCSRSAVFRIASASGIELHYCAAHKATRTLEHFRPAPGSAFQEIAGHPKPLPTQPVNDEVYEDDDDDCDCDTAIEDILTGRVDCYVCGNFWYR